MTEFSCLKCGIRGTNTNAKDRSQTAAPARRWKTCTGCFDVYCFGKKESCWNSWDESQVLHESEYEDQEARLCFDCCLSTRTAEQAMHDIGAAVATLMAMHAAGEPEENKQPSWHKLRFSVFAINRVSEPLRSVLKTTLADVKHLIEAPKDFHVDFRNGAFKHAITSQFDPKVMDPEALERRLEDLKRQVLDFIALADETLVEGSGGGGGEGTAGPGKRRCFE